MAVKKVTDLGEKECIHCETEEEAIAICKMMHEAGLRWYKGQSYLEENNFHTYKDKTCYRPYGGVFCGKQYYELDLFTIHKAKDFIKTNTMRKLTREDFKRLYNSACSEWQNKLMGELGSGLIFKDDTTVSDELYKEMREAADKSQQKLLDEVFGKDDEVFNAGDWVVITSFGNKQSWGSFSLNKAYELSEDLNQKRSFSVCRDDNNRKNGYYTPFNSGMRFRKATPEEIMKAQIPPKGTPCLVRDYDYEEWTFGISNGDGFYDTTVYDRHMYKQVHSITDINNLPKI